MNWRGVTEIGVRLGLVGLFISAVTRMERDVLRVRRQTEERHWPVRQAIHASGSDMAVGQMCPGVYPGQQHPIADVRDEEARGNLFRRHFFFFQAEDGIRDYKVTGVQTCALPI